MKNKMCDLKMERVENNFNEYDNNSDKNEKIFQRKKFRGQLLIHTFQINILNN